MSEVRLALVGTGRWGLNIKKTLEAMPQCTLAYTATLDWPALLQKTDIDGVIVATPPSSHAEIALPFIERGVPVFIEKPMTGTLADAERIAAAAQKSGALVMVGHIHLYNPAYRKTKELLKDIGAIRFIASRGYNNGPYREDFSALWDWAPHDIAMMLDLFGGMPQKVSAWAVAPSRPGTTLWDFAQIKLEWSGGRTGFSTNSWLMPQKCKQLTIVGEKKSLVYEDTLPEKKVALYEGADVSYPDYEAGLPLTLEMQAFIRTIAEKEKPYSDASMGLTVVQILDAAERSIAADGQPQKIS